MIIAPNQNIFNLAYLGPDDFGIWQRTLHDRVEALLNAFVERGVIFSNTVHVVNIDEDSVPPWLDKHDAEANSRLLHQDQISEADLVVILVTRSNLHKALWAIGYAEGLEKNLIIFDTANVPYLDTGYATYEHQLVDLNHDVDISPYEEMAKILFRRIIEKNKLYTARLCPYDNRESSILTVELAWVNMLMEWRDKPELLAGVSSVRITRLRETPKGCRLQLEYTDPNWEDISKERLRELSGVAAAVEVIPAYRPEYIKVVWPYTDCNIFKKGDRALYCLIGSGQFFWHPDKKSWFKSKRESIFQDAKCEQLTLQEVNALI